MQLGKRVYKEINAQIIDCWFNADSVYLKSLHRHEMSEFGYRIWSIIEIFLRGTRYPVINAGVKS